MRNSQEAAKGIATPCSGLGRPAPAYGSPSTVSNGARSSPPAATIPPACLAACRLGRARAPHCRTRQKRCSPMLQRVARPRHARAARPPSCNRTAGQVAALALCSSAAAPSLLRFDGACARCRARKRATLQPSPTRERGRLHTGHSQLHRAAVAHSPRAHHGWHSERPSTCAIKQRRLLAGKSSTRHNDCAHRGSGGTPPVRLRCPARDYACQRRDRLRSGTDACVCASSDAGRRTWDRAGSRGKSTKSTRIQRAFAAGRMFMTASKTAPQPPALGQGVSR